MEMTKEQMDKLEELKKLEEQMRKIITEKTTKEMETLEREKYEKMKLDMITEVKKALTPEKKTPVFDPKAEIKDGEFSVKSFAEFLEMVRTSDPRIAHLKTTTVSAPESTTSAQGGYTIPNNWSAEILGSLNEESVADAKCTPVDITVGNSIYLNSILTDITVGWSTEATRKNTTKPTLSQATLSLRYIYAIISRSQELANGTITNWDAFHKQLVSENFALEFDNQILQANAAPFTGILNAVGVNAVAQAAASLAYSDLTAVINNNGQLMRYKRGAEWYLTQNGINTCMNIVDLNGLPIWHLNNPKLGQMPDLCGYPFNISDQITDTISADGTSSFVFGNMKYEYKARRTGQDTINVLWTNVGVISADDGTSTYNLFQDNMEAWRFELARGYLTAIPAAFVKLTGVKP